MSFSRRIRWPAVAGFVLVAATVAAASSFQGTDSRPPAPGCERAGYREFDFFLGEWDVYDVGGSNVKATNSVARMLDGCALREVYRRTDGYAGESFSTYDTLRSRWHQSWVTNRGELLLLDGEMKDGSMVLTGSESAAGRIAPVIRGVWRPGRDGTVRETADRSTDNGKTWNRVFDIEFRPHGRSSHEPSVVSAPVVRDSTSGRDGRHDFDFEIGTWKTHLSRLLHPLTGSTAWVVYDGTTTVRPVWNGRANLLELTADGPAGHFEGLNLRLYNPESHQWSLNFSNSGSGALSQPTIGEFKNGRGEFYDQETFNERAILVRFVISGMTPDSCHFEQAFSDDGGKTWEVNWIATDTRSVLANPLNEVDRARLLNELDASRKRVVSSLAGVSQAQWTFKAGPARWSIAEVTEHIVKAEGFISAVVRKSLITEPADSAKAASHRPNNVTLDENALAAIRDRSKKVEAPAPIVPSGMYKTPREALDAFNHARDITIDYVRTTRDDLRDHFSSQITGNELDGVQGLLTLSGHVERHVAQIEEVKHSTGYPPK
jgi:hypothetical protein